MPGQPLSVTSDRSKWIATGRAETESTVGTNRDADKTGGDNAMLRRMCVGLIVSLTLLGLPLVGTSGAAITKGASATQAKVAWQAASNPQGMFRRR